MATLNSNQHHADHGHDNHDLHDHEHHQEKETSKSRALYRGRDFRRCSDPHTAGFRFSTRRRPAVARRNRWGNDAFRRCAVAQPVSLAVEAIRHAENEVALYSPKRPPGPKAWHSRPSSGLWPENRRDRRLQQEVGVGLRFAC